MPLPLSTPLPRPPASVPAVPLEQVAFVVLPTSIDVGDRKWQWLAPGTYDSTNIIELGRLDAPAEMTLLGPSGSRVISSDRRVALSNSWQIGMDQTRAAIEITLADGDDFQIAVAGRARDAQWFSLEHKGSNASAVWWLAKLGIVGADYINVQPVTGTDYELVEYIANDTSGFALRRGKTDVGRYSGSPIGAMQVNGRFFIVTKNNGQLTTIEASPTATRS